MVGVVVVGAGVVGSAVAAHLARAGARVALVEAHTPGSGTSGATVGWINAVDDYPREYYELRVAAMREHAALERELGADWLRPTGMLEWAVDETAFEALDAKVDRLQAWGYAAERVAPDDVATLEPGLVLPGVPWVASYPGDAWVQPESLVRALVDAAVGSGATLHVGRRVTAVAAAGGRVRGVVLDGYERLRADVVVNSAGPAAAAVAALAGADLPLERDPGLVLSTTPTAATLRRVVRAAELTLRPEAGDRVLVSPHFATVAEDAPPPGPDEAVSREALRRASRLLPALADATIASARVGVRPIAPDGLPLVGPLPGLDGVYVAVTHSGMTLGPLLGRLVAEEVVAGDRDPRLARFRPDRLVESVG